MDDRTALVDGKVTISRKGITPSTSRDFCFDLPEELLHNVLAFLPISSLLRFRTVCKNWNSFVKDPRFQKARASVTNSGEPFVFYDAFIRHVFNYSANKTTQLVTCAGGFLLLENVFHDLHVVDPANVYLKEIPHLDLNPGSTVKCCRYTVGMAVSSETKSYSIFVASKNFDKNCFRRGPISVQRYDSTRGAWRVAWNVPLASMELHCELLNVVMHRGSVYFLIMGRTEIRLGGTLKFRVSHYDEQHQRWENLSGRFPTLRYNTLSVPLLFAYGGRLFLAAPFLGRYSIWQYNDEAGEWGVLDNMPELARSEDSACKTQVYAQHCGEFLYVGKWPQLCHFTPSVVMYNLRSREFSEMPSEQVQSAQVRYWPGKYGRRFFFEAVH